MTRTDKAQARRTRALEALKKDRVLTQEKVDTLQASLIAFYRNERSLDQPTAAVERQLQDARRDLDRQTMEIHALEKEPSQLDSSTRKRGTYELSQYLNDMKTHER